MKTFIAYTHTHVNNYLLFTLNIQNDECHSKYSTYPKHLRVKFGTQSS